MAEGDLVIASLRSFVMKLLLVCVVASILVLCYLNLDTIIPLIHAKDEKKMHQVDSALDLAKKNDNKTIAKLMRMKVIMDIMDRTDDVEEINDGDSGCLSALVLTASNMNNKSWRETGVTERITFQGMLDGLRSDVDIYEDRDIDIVLEIVVRSTDPFDNTICFEEACTPKPWGGAVTRSFFSAILSGENNTISDSVNTIVIGGTGNHITKGRNVVLASAFNKVLRATNKAQQKFIDNTLFANSLQIDAGLRTTEVIVAPSKETLLVDESGILVYDITPDDYLVIIDPRNVSKDAQGKNAWRISIMLPLPRDMFANQQVVVRMIDDPTERATRSSISRGEPFRNSNNNPPLSVFVTCARDPYAEGVILDSIIQDAISSMAKGVSEITVEAKDGIYVTCMSRHPRVGRMYKCDTVTRTMYVLSTKVTINIPVFVQEVPIDAINSKSVWLVWSMYTETWMILN